MADHHSRLALAAAGGGVPPTEAQIDEYIDGYVLEGDDGFHVPVDHERFMIKDAIMGLIAEHWSGDQPDPTLGKCAECGKTSTPNSMWALYCLPCIQEKIVPARASSPQPEAAPAVVQGMVLRIYHDPDSQWWSITADWNGQPTGLYIANPSLDVCVRDILPSWRKMAELSPSQVPPIPPAAPEEPAQAQPLQSLAAQMKPLEADAARIIADNLPELYATGEAPAHAAPSAGEVERDRKDAQRLRTVLEVFGKREDNMPLTNAERCMLAAFDERGSYTIAMKIAAIDAALSHKEQP